MHNIISGGVGQESIFSAFIGNAVYRLRDIIQSEVRAYDPGKLSVSVHRRRYGDAHSPDQNIHIGIRDDGCSCLLRGDIPSPLGGIVPLRRLRLRIGLYKKLLRGSVIQVQKLVPVCGLGCHDGLDMRRVIIFIAKRRDRNCAGVIQSDLPIHPCIDAVCVFFRINLKLLGTVCPQIPACKEHDHHGRNHHGQNYYKNGGQRKLVLYAALRLHIAVASGVLYFLPDVFLFFHSFPPSDST